MSTGLSVETYRTLNSSMASIKFKRDLSKQYVKVREMNKMNNSIIKNMYNST